MRIRILKESIWLQFIYFLTTISFWFVECLFPIHEKLFQNVTEFTLCFLYCLNQPLLKSHGITSINFGCFTIVLPFKSSKIFRRKQAVLAIVSFFFIFFKKRSTTPILLKSNTSFSILKKFFISVKY